MSSDECLFCKLAERSVEAAVLFEDEHALAFSDINPQAPVHFLVIPRKHIASLADVSPSDQSLLGHLLLVARKVAEAQKLSRAGYRIVINTGADSGQTVFHMHVHVLGRRTLRWPPG